MTDNLPPLPSPKLHACRCGVVHADFDGESMEDYARAALAQAQSLPDGLVLVPVEPTVAIISAMMKSQARDDEGCFPMLMDHIDYSGENKTRTVVKAAYKAALAASPQPQPVQPSEQPRLTVRLTAFPESNGKRNWTALLVRVGPWGGLIGNCGGIQVGRGELWNRVAYEAECARFLIGERDTEPHILDYGDDIETPEQWVGEVRGGRPARKVAQAKPEQAAQPLTPAQIEALEREASELVAPPEMTESMCLEWLVRKVEAAHGIAAPKPKD